MYTEHGGTIAKYSLSPRIYHDKSHSRSRRVVVLRRRVKDSLVAESGSEGQQQALHFIDRSDKVKLWEYAVLVTNTDHALESIGQVIPGSGRLRERLR